jgi:hypothetical protein
VLYAAVLAALKAVQNAEKKPPCPQRLSTETYSHQQMVLALPRQGVCGSNFSPKPIPLEPASQLVFSGNYKITTMLGPDGSTTSSCSITLPGGMEFKLTLPDKTKNALIPGEKKNSAEPANFILDQSVSTVHNQKITRVYYRKNKAARPPSPQHQPIFEEPLAFLTDGPPNSQRKRKLTPLATQDLRRSKRTMEANKGFKSPSLSEANISRKGRSSSKCSSFQKGKNQLFNLTIVFPDLAAIDRLTSMGILHPQISIPQLQMVGQEVCELLPSEVAEWKALL